MSSGTMPALSYAAATSLLMPECDRLHSHSGLIELLQSCLYVYIYIYIYVYTCAYEYDHVYSYMSYTYIHVYICIYIYTLYTYIYIYICTYTHTSLSLYIYIYIYVQSLSLSIYIYIYKLPRQLAVRSRQRLDPGQQPDLRGWGNREFTKGGLVKGSLAIRHVFNLHMKNGA